MPSEHAGARRIDVRKTYKLYVGGAFPRQRVRPLLRGDRRQGPLPGQRGAWPRARTRATPSSPRARRSPAGRRATAYNRGQVLYRVAEVLEGRRAQFVDEVARGEGAARAQGRRASSTPRSTGGSGTPAGPTRSPRCSAAANPVAGPYFDFSVPEPTGVVAVLAPQESSLLGLVSVVAPVDRHRQHRASCWPASGARCRRSRWPRCSRPPTCPAAWSTSSPAAPPRSRPWLASHMDVNAIDLAGAAGRRASLARLEVAAADNLKRVLRRRPRASRTGPPTRASTGCARVPRDQDRLAPHRRLTVGRWPRRGDPAVVLLAGPSGSGQVPPRGGVRAAAARPRRLLQGRRRPDLPAAPDPGHRRLGRPAVLGREGAARGASSGLPRRLGRCARLRHRARTGGSAPASASGSVTHGVRGHRHLRRRARRPGPRARPAADARRADAVPGEVLPAAASTRDLREHRKPP